MKNLKEKLIDKIMNSISYKKQKKKLKFPIKISSYFASNEPKNFRKNKSSLLSFGEIYSLEKKKKNFESPNEIKEKKSRELGFISYQTLQDSMNKEIENKIIKITNYKQLFYIKIV